MLIVFTYIFTRLILFELEFSELIGDYRWYQSKKNTVPEPVKATITPVASPFFFNVKKKFCHCIWQQQVNMWWARELWCIMMTFYALNPTY